MKSVRMPRNLVFQLTVACSPQPEVRPAEIDPRMALNLDDQDRVLRFSNSGFGDKVMSNISQSGCTSRVSN